MTAKRDKDVLLRVPFMVHGPLSPAYLCFLSLNCHSKHESLHVSFGAIWNH